MELDASVELSQVLANFKPQRLGDFVSRCEQAQRRAACQRVGVLAAETRGRETRGGGSSDDRILDHPSADPCGDADAGAEENTENAPIRTNCAYGQTALRKRVPHEELLTVTQYKHLLAQYTRPPAQEQVARWHRNLRNYSGRGASSAPTKSLNKRLAAAQLRAPIIRSRGAVVNVRASDTRTNPVKARLMREIRELDKTTRSLRRRYSLRRPHDGPEFERRGRAGRRGSAFSEHAPSSTNAIRATTTATQHAMDALTRHVQLRTRELDSLAFGGQDGSTRKQVAPRRSSSSNSSSSPTALPDSVLAEPHSHQPCPQPGAGADADAAVPGSERARSDPNPVATTPARLTSGPQLVGSVAFLHGVRVAVDEFLLRHGAPVRACISDVASFEQHELAQSHTGVSLNAIDLQIAARRVRVLRLQYALAALALFADSSKLRRKLLDGLHIRRLQASKQAYWDAWQLHHQVVRFRHRWRETNPAGCVGGKSRIATTMVHCFTIDACALACVACFSACSRVYVLVSPKELSHVGV